jgi:hypothetical protein
MSTRIWLFLVVLIAISLALCLQLSDPRFWMLLVAALYLLLIGFGAVLPPILDWLGIEWTPHACGEDESRDEPRF